MLEEDILSKSNLDAASSLNTTPVLFVLILFMLCTPLPILIATLANRGIKNELTVIKDVVSSEGVSVSGELIDSVIDAKINKEEQEYGDSNDNR